MTMPSLCPEEQTMTTLRTLMRYAAALSLPLLISTSSAAADFEQSIPVSPGGTLRIDIPGGSIDVETHDEDRVDIDARIQGGLELEVERVGNDVEVTGHVTGVFGFFGFGKVRVHARVPEHFHLDLRTQGGHVDVQELLGHVVARTSGGRIQVQQIEGNVAAETSGGSIEIKEIAGDLFGVTSGGSIRASEIEGSVEVETMGGSIRVNKVGGPVSAITTGGSIEVEFTGTPSGEVRTAGGSITVKAPKESSFHLKARTIGGSVRLDDDFEKDDDRRRDPDRRERERRRSRHGVGELDVHVNGGGEALELDTTGGSIRVDSN